LIKHQNPELVIDTPTFLKAHFISPQNPLIDEVFPKRVKIFVHFISKKIPKTKLRTAEKNKKKLFSTPASHQLSFLKSRMECPPPSVKDRPAWDYVERCETEEPRTSLSCFSFSLGQGLVIYDGVWGGMKGSTKTFNKALRGGVSRGFRGYPPNSWKIDVNFHQFLLQFSAIFYVIFQGLFKPPISITVWYI
jgi:hypothetical protein